MIIPEIEFILKDGRTAIIRSPRHEDAQAMIDYLRLSSGETDFLLRCPEECDCFTLEGEKEFFDSAIASPDRAMLVCTVDGKLAGNCMLTRYPFIKSRHRADVAIALLREFWGLGIGTKMFEELFRIAREIGVQQLELDFVEGNSRARALYEKTGFRIVGVKPDSVWLRDGTLLNEYSMIKKL